MDDPPRDTKPMDDMMFDEINHVRSFDFNQWYSFRPPWKVIGYCQDKTGILLSKRGWLALRHRFPMLQMAMKQQLGGSTPEASVWSPHEFGMLYTFVHIRWHRYHGWLIISKLCNLSLSFGPGWCAPHMPSCASLSTSCASELERQRRRTPSYERR